jgi:hypothetical protein
LHTEKQLGRFWSKVQKTDGCWFWTQRGGAAPKSYGHITRWRNGRSVPAHRASWEIHHGEIPAGKQVCHHCDVKRCVRPDHLFLGTARENLQDAAVKGRIGQARGAEPIPRTDPRWRALAIRRIEAGQRVGYWMMVTRHLEVCRDCKCAWAEFLVKAIGRLCSNCEQLFFPIKRKPVCPLCCPDESEAYGATAVVIKLT